MQPGDGAELIEEQTIHAPTFRNNILILPIKLLHLPLNKAIPPFCIFEYTILKGAKLLLISLQDNPINFLNKLPIILIAQDLNDLDGCRHILLSDDGSAVLVRLVVLGYLQVQLLHHFVLVFVQLLDLRDLLVFFKVF
jgi:hypothetical protein